jgi:hypothetical protein
LATVTLSDTTTSFEGLRLRISAGAGPTIEVSLPVNHPWKREDRLDVATLLGKRAELSWEQQQVSFRVTGFRSSPGGSDLMLGIVLSDETLNWMEMRRTETGQTSMLVYQRDANDANGWSFLLRVLGSKFATPHGSERLDTALPVGTCFVRPAGCDNLVHQERILGLLRNSPTQPWGWCAVDAQDGTQPMRLLGLDSPIVELDKGWSPADESEVFLPHRALGPSAPMAKLRRTFEKLTHAQAALVVREVTSKGLVTALDPKAFEGAKDVVCLPCQVAVGGSVALCPTISFSFDMRSHIEEQEVELSTELNLRPLPTTPAVSPARFTTEGTFKEWDSDSKETRVVVMPPDPTWQMMAGAKSSDVETADPDRGLVCESVTPFGGRDNRAGFYVSHKADDPVLVEVLDGHEPRMVGMRQVLAKGLESVDLVLNSETVSISGLAKDADLATADGVAVDGSGGTVEVFAAQHVALKQKVTVTDESTQMDHNASVKKVMSVGGDTTIGGKTEIKGDTVIKATLEVGP